MTPVAALLAQAHRIENEAGGYLTRAVITGRATVPRLAAVSTEFRRAADLVEQAAAQMTQMKKKETDKCTPR